MASQIQSEQAEAEIDENGNSIKVDKGTQDYSGYFGNQINAPRFDLVPRVDPQAIHDRNANLVKQALQTRNLLAIPRNLIKTKKGSKNSISHYEKQTQGKTNSKLKVAINNLNRFGTPLETDDFEESAFQEDSTFQANANDDNVDKTNTVSSNDHNK